MLNIMTQLGKCKLNPSEVPLHTHKKIYTQGMTMQSVEWDVDKLESAYISGGNIK